MDRAPGLMSLKMEMLFAALILAYLQSFVLSNPQGDALIALKLSMNVPNNQLTDWNQNLVNPCTWTNVICDKSSNVFSVTLSDINCSGTLSPMIGALRTLTTLTLKGNGITGGIPKEFGNLSSLISLDLGNNRLSGEIPSSLGDLKKLQFLTLSQNNLIGAIPESLASLQNLTNILLDSNNLSGQVPNHLFQIPKYNFTGNHLNCGGLNLHLCESYSGDSGGSHKSKIGIIVGVVGGFVILFLFGGLLFFVCKGRRKGYKREIFVDVAGEVDRRITFGQLKRFAWRELQLATDNFKEDDVLLLDHVKKLEREKRLDAIVDRNLNKNYNIQEVEMMIKVALLCTQASPEDRPAMSEVVRMLEGEGLAERWEEWQHVEVTRREEYSRLQRRFDLGEDSLYDQDAIELSGGR
uniref:Putative LRR receptor-like serine/threonine-protein kinase n=1 Tax=Populus alba TaxID=43335 RepID=A0A4U5N8T4_POPAL|nr:putative LRR receptor-like serine/threonine-protein kinase [Populus alba]